MTLYFVTSNLNKFREVKNELEKLGVVVVQKALSYPELQADSPEEVVKAALRTIALLEPFIIEDAGLFIRALNNFPGVYSSFVFKTLGCDGILKLLKGKKDRYAEFRSVIGLKMGNSKKIFTGICKGEISTCAKGHGGFGYDPIFIPNGKKKTFAEMSIKEKNRCSHRGKAVQKLGSYLKGLRLSHYRDSSWNEGS
ncbi:MAG: XTP/dITP diphosphatase [Candidatus Thermoplasmatota archaeon]|nr:XTP/dITP diphosphatase [Candidatus Thermoplasmatota archaeon]